MSIPWEDAIHWLKEGIEDGDLSDFFKMIMNYELFKTELNKYLQDCGQEIREIGS